ncbi:dihydrodipicolinate synthase family protein [Mesorhizobium montanum]|uniref:dihydrodipicolinate synthase family protein n=1 Tax=Mesorhizobium montanum TaxID=3072323 RepID=UPI003D31834D
MFTGSIAALVTLFRAGKVDEKALQDLVQWQIDEGTHGLVRAAFQTSVPERRLQEGAGNALARLGRMTGDVRLPLFTVSPAIRTSFARRSKRRCSMP